MLLRIIHGIEYDSESYTRKGTDEKGAEHLGNDIKTKKAYKLKKRL